MPAFPRGAEVFRGRCCVAAIWRTSQVDRSRFLVRKTGHVLRKREAMNKVMTSVKNFLVSEDGPTAVEYAVMLALIIVVCIGAVTTIGTKANAKFQSAASVL